jgi:hypothetical protein
MEVTTPGSIENSPYIYTHTGLKLKVVFDFSGSENDIYFETEGVEALDSTRDLWMVLHSCYTSGIAGTNFGLRSN